MIKVLKRKGDEKLYLKLGNYIQFSDADQNIYHEFIADFPLSYLEKCKNVLVIGGGDGGVRCSNLGNTIQLLLPK
jgi:predicted membrane-bound spermidine synthase